MKRIALLAILSAVALPIAIALAPGQRSRLLRVELLILGACGLMAVAQLVARAAPDNGGTALDPRRPSRPPNPAPPAGLVTIARRLQLSSIHAGDAHYWVRPMVRAIAADRLELRRGLDLDRPGDLTVAQVLGPVAHQLAQPATRRPDDPFAPGISRSELEAAVTALEAI
jgi:hypothetical protein